MPYCTTSSHKINFPFPCPSDFFHIVPSSHLEKKQKIFAKSVFPCNLLTFSPTREHQKSNRNVAQPGLARLTGGQKVESSNLSVPTIAFPIARQWLTHWRAVSFLPTSSNYGTCADSPFVPILRRRTEKRPFRGLLRPSFRRFSPFEKTAGFSLKSTFSASKRRFSPLFS